MIKSKSILCWQSIELDKKCPLNQHESPLSLSCTFNFSHSWSALPGVDLETVSEMVRRIESNLPAPQKHLGENLRLYSGRFGAKRSTLPPGQLFGPRPERLYPKEYGEAESGLPLVFDVNALIQPREKAKFEKYQQGTNAARVKHARMGINVIDTENGQIRQRLRELA